MTDFSSLLGLTLEEASRILDERQLSWVSGRYFAFRPLENTDTERVVRVKTLPDGSLEVLVCAFTASAGKTTEAPDG